jgi:hypothetical protein
VGSCALGIFAKSLMVRKILYDVISAKKEKK